MISSSMKVRDVAINSSHATRVFEKLKIDYCCGGDRPLGEACAAAGVELEALKQMLDETGTVVTDRRPDFQNLSSAELTQYIVETHHVFTKTEMTRLLALIAKVVSAHGENHSELLAVKTLFQQLCDDLKQHMFKEERILFPFIVKLEQSRLEGDHPPMAPFGAINNPIRMMMLEHDTAGEILREIRLLTSDFTVPADGCISYRTLYQALEAFEQDLHQHVHLENNILFPKAVGLEVPAVQISESDCRASTN
jgi:regulator of cell morphogenesis and NO signaling